MRARLKEKIARKMKIIDSMLVDAIMVNGHYLAQDPTWVDELRAMMRDLRGRWPKIYREVF